MITEEIIRELLPYVQDDKRTDFATHVERLLKPRSKRITLEEALDVVCAKTECDKSATLSTSRKGLYPFSRQLTMFVMKGCNKSLGLSEIGKMLGKDHATVIHAVRMVRQDYVGCRTRKRIIDEVLTEINSKDLYAFL